MKRGHLGRAAAVVAAGLLAVIVFALPAHAIDAGTQLIVAVELHADGIDGISACQDKPFGEGVEDFGDSIAAALGLPLTDVAAHPGSECLSLLPHGTVTRPGPGGERIFRLDGGSLRSLADRAGYQEAFVVVCTPQLSSRTEVRTGNPPLEASGCDANGYAWNVLEPLDVDVAFRATAADLAGGLMSALSWWIALATLAGLAAVRGSTSRMVKSMPVAAGAAGVFAAAAAAYGWLFVATRSALIDALHVKAGLGTGGETALVSVGSSVAVLLALFTTRYAIRAAKRPAASAGASAPLLPGVPALPLRDVVAPYPGIVSRAGAGLLWAFVPGVSLAIAYLIFLVTPAALEIKIEGMLAVAITYAVLTPALAGATFPAVYNAQRMNQPTEAPLRDALRAAGSRVAEVWVSPVPPAAAPAGGAIMVAGRRAFVWHPLAAMPATELAGAIALRGAKRRPWAGAAGAVLVVVVMNTISIGSRVPAIVMTAAVAVVAMLGFTDRLERIRIRTADRTPESAEAHARGLLTAGRAHARLAAGGALGVLAVPMPGYAQSHWERTLRLTHRLGLQSGLSTVAVARIADEVVAADAQRTMPVLTEARGAASTTAPGVPASAAVAVLPATGTHAEDAKPMAPAKRAPAKKKAAPRKKAAAKRKSSPVKKAATRKKTVAKKKAAPPREAAAKRKAAKKSATRRAPAKRGRRPRS